MDFKAFLDAVTAGERRRDLFLFANNAQRDQALITLFNDASERHLCPILRHIDHCIILGDNALATFRIAYPSIAREVAGIPWTGMHGLETLDKYEGGVAMALHLQAMVRNVP